MVCARWSELQNVVKARMYGSFRRSDLLALQAGIGATAVRDYEIRLNFGARPNRGGARDGVLPGPRFRSIAVVDTHQEGVHVDRVPDAGLGERIGSVEGDNRFPAVRF